MNCPDCGSDHTADATKLGDPVTHRNLICTKCGIQFRERKELRYEVNSSEFDSFDEALESSSVEDNKSLRTLLSRKKRWIA